MRTTGFDPLGGHRLVEIGAVELVNLSLTGQVFHSYLNPERAMPADAIAVHGLTAAFLADKPLFGAVADELLAFVGDAPLVAHNAGFDIAFLNAELKHAGKPPIVIDRAIDTLVLARRKRTGTCVMAKRPLHISEGFRSSNPRAQASTSFPFLRPERQPFGDAVEAPATSSRAWWVAATCRRVRSNKHRADAPVLSYSVLARRPLIICTPGVNGEFFVTNWLHRPVSFDRRYPPATE
jgi:hypothetical protein